MIEKNYKLIAEDFVPNESDFGQVTSEYPMPAFEADTSMGFGEALLKGSIVNRTANRLAQISSNVILDRDKPEEGFNPFEQWKEYGADDALLGDFMATKNSYELMDLLSRLNEENERRKIIEQYGLAGEAADFVAGVATDPLTYLGFGAGMMLKSGMGATKAFALSGAGAGAAIVAAEEFASPEQMDLQKGATIIAASTVLSGILGGAVESYARLKAKNIVKNDFQTMAYDSMQSAADLPKRIDAMGLSADAVPKPLQNYNAGVAGGKAVRVLSKFVAKTLQAPRLLMQTAESKEISQELSRFYGSTLKTQSNVEELKAGATYNFGEYTETVRQIDKGWISQRLDDGKIVKMFGEEISDIDREIVARSLFENGANAESLTPKQRYLFDQNREFYENKSREFLENGVPYFNRREAYGFPVQFSPAKVSERIGEFKQKVYETLLARRSGAEEAMRKLDEQYNAVKKILDETPDPRFRGPLQAQLQNIEDLIERNRILTASTDGELLNEASMAAMRIEGGDFSPNSFLPPGASVSKAGFFNERIIDPLEYLDYLDLDFKSLMVKYSDGTSPHLALKKAFPEYNGIDEVIAGVTKKAEDNMGSYKDPKKIKKEIEKAQKLMRRSWDQETGLERARQVSDLGDLAPWLSSLDSAAYITQMGGQTIAALSEPINGTIFHGLKYGTDLTGVMAKLASDPLLNQIVSKEASRLGIGLEVAMADFRMSAIASEITEAEVSTALSRNMKKGALLMSKANLSTYFDRFTRKAALVVQQGIFKDHIDNFSSLSKDIKGDLAFLGIDKDNVATIKSQLDKYGKEERGIFVSNVEKWDNALARDIFISAIRKDQRRMTSQADLGDVAHFYRTPVGQLAMKYKTWATTATQKLFLGSAQQGSRALPGVAAAVSMGAFVQYMLDLSQGKEPSADPEEILYAGIVRSGLAGIFPDVGGSMLLNRLAGIESGGAKYYSYMDAPDIIAGPVGALIGDIGGVLGAPMPKMVDGELQMGYETRSGDIRQGSVNSLVNVLPIPLVKPWVKEYSKEIIEQ